MDDNARSIVVVIMYDNIFVQKERITVLVVLLVVLEVGMAMVAARRLLAVAFLLLGVLLEWLSNIL